MFTKADSPLPASAESWLPNVDSFVKFNISVKLVSNRLPQNTYFRPVLEVVLVHSSLLGKVGINVQLNYDTVLKSGAGVCCDEATYQKGLCADTQLGRMIISGTTGHTNEQRVSSNFHYWAIYEGNMSSSYLYSYNLLQTVAIQSTGVWYVIIANCNLKDVDENGLLVSKGSQTVHAGGILEWKNPYGYLPGQIAAYLPIYWSLAVFFFLFLILWNILCCVYRKGLMTLQFLIGLVFLSCLIESAVNGAGYLIYNLEGRIYLYTVGISAFLTAAQETLIRILFLVVGMGLSITRVRLSIPEYLFMTILSLCFFAFDMAAGYERMTTSTGEPVLNFIQWVAVAGVYFTNIVFIVWIVFATFTTMMELKAAGQTFKFGQYKTLVILMLISVAISVVLWLFQIVVESMQVQDNWFQWWWMSWEMCWEVIHLAALIAISILWRPAANNAQYAYSQQIPQDDPDGKMIDLEGDGDVPVSLDGELDIKTPDGTLKANISSDEDSLTSSSL